MDSINQENVQGALSKSKQFKVLIAEDDFISRRMLEKKLINWGYDVIAVEDGKQALEALQSNSDARIALLDWMMPELDGVEVCKRIREKTDGSYIYIIILTAKARVEDISIGLNAGADDYIVKPFNHNELYSRLLSAKRVVALEVQLADKIEELENALSQVKFLKGFLPICGHCKNIRNDSGYWQKVEVYVHEHTDAVFSHSICPDCLEKHYPDFEDAEDSIAESNSVGT